MRLHVEPSRNGPMSADESRMSPIESMSFARTNAAIGGRGGTSPVVESQEPGMRATPC